MSADRIGSDSPATLYGPASLGLGFVALCASVFSGFIGIAFALLAGALAVTFGLLGLSGGFNRGQCVGGLLLGSVGVIVFGVIAGGF